MVNRDGITNNRRQCLSANRIIRDAYCMKIGTHTITLAMVPTDSRYLLCCVDYLLVYAKMHRK